MFGMVGSERHHTTPSRGNQRRIVEAFNNIANSALIQAPSFRALLVWRLGGLAMDLIAQTTPSSHLPQTSVLHFGTFI